MHGTCGLINPWRHLQKMSSWVGNPGRPPYVISCGSAGLKKKLNGPAGINWFCMSTIWYMCIHFFKKRRPITFTKNAARPNFSQPSSCIALVYQSACSRTIADRLLYDWIAEKKNWSSGSCIGNLFQLQIRKSLLQIGLSKIAKNLIHYLQ